MHSVLRFSYKEKNIKIEEKQKMLLETEKMFKAQNPN